MPATEKISTRVPTLFMEYKLLNDTTIILSYIQYIIYICQFDMDIDLKSWRLKFIYYTLLILTWSPANTSKSRRHGWRACYLAMNIKHFDLISCYKSWIGNILGFKGIISDIIFNWLIRVYRANKLFRIHEFCLSNK